MSVPIVRTAKSTGVIKQRRVEKADFDERRGHRLQQDQGSEQIKPRARPQLDELDPGDVPGTSRASPAAHVAMPSDRQRNGRLAATALADRPPEH